MDGEPIGLFLSNSGAEAIEASVKLAKIATRRPLVVAFRGGFHGRTHGTMALTSSGVRIRGHYEPLPGGVHFVPFPDPLRVGGGDAEAALAVTLAAIEELFATLCFPDDVAAFLVEPVLGEGGYVVPSDNFLPALRELADKHGILLIADEVQTGYGRTGRFFASEWSRTVPDIVVMAKGIASGMPLSGHHGPPLIAGQVRARHPRRHLRRQRGFMRGGASNARRVCRGRPGGYGPAARRAIDWRAASRGHRALLAWPRCAAAD